MPLGLYISVPFCRSKCSYCNFASGVFSRERFEQYVERVSADLAGAAAVAERAGGCLERSADTLYLGGGTPTALAPQQLESLFAAVRRHFTLSLDAEITVECAPGSLSPAMLDTLIRCGVNRVSLGVQSFVDAEAAAVGRLHTRVTVLDDVARLRAAGIANLNIDLIAGLPHQTAATWDYSAAEAIALGAPHVSIYMLEVDEDSRLGSELLAGGTRYHAHFVPDDDATADFYLRACERLQAAGIAQYEISNFARPGAESRHNLKYWTRQPYLGFGVDAHSMLPALEPAFESVRFSTPDSLDDYLAGKPGTITPVTQQAALEESFFLGLRLGRGIDLREVAAHFGAPAIENLHPVIAQSIASGLLERGGDRIRLTPRGRLLSNEVFAGFLSANQPGRQLPPGRVELSAKIH
ncbi:MAG TPA: radical SAM family heme chaperone HemW [Terriglobales bacterium]|jgi:oxygen-independent coproporphyrinogen-3 oxidase|nr:radical SAM family heme chaperone HemW [Terriglobales bacterium]